MEISQEQKLTAQIIQKAWEDAQFKNELMVNPVNAIEKLTGQKMNLPQGQKFVVVDQTDESTVYFNIPRQIDVESLELTDEQLEMIAGGDAIAVGAAVFGAAAAVGGFFIACFAAGYNNGKDLATSK